MYCKKKDCAYNKHGGCFNARIIPEVGGILICSRNKRKGQPIVIAEKPHENIRCIMADCTHVIKIKHGHYCGKDDITVFSERTVTKYVDRIELRCNSYSELKTKEN